MPSLLCLTAAVVLSLATSPVPTTEPTAFVDQVETLQLDRPLDTRGNLGGMTVDRLGFVYTSNFRDAVWRIDPDGKVETLTRGLYGASGNAVDSRGDLFQANFYGNTITKIDRLGNASAFAVEGLDGPVGIAVDPQNTLYVCNCSGNTISRVAPDGTVSPFAESELFACPNGITFDDQGQLFVTNFNNHEILRISEAGETSRFVTVSGGAGNAHIVFSRGFFYITKIMAHQLFKVSAAGEITHLAGTGRPGHDDGPALDATLHRPNGITISPGGDRLYVNTLLGEYNQPEASTITIRTVELMTLTKALDEALESGGVGALEETYRRYRADPVRGRENTVAEMITYGYTFLSSRRIPEALAVFTLNASANPDVAAAQFQLGEAYRYTGQTNEAIAQYERTLELDPSHPLAATRLAQVRKSG